MLTPGLAKKLIHQNVFLSTLWLICTETTVIIILKLLNNSFYLHEIMVHDGNEFKFHSADHFLEEFRLLNKCYGTTGKILGFWGLGGGLLLFSKRVYGKQLHFLAI